MRSSLLFVGLVAAAAAARVGVGCGGDDPEGAPAPFVNPGGDGSGGDDDGATASDDASIDGGVDAGPPSYCKGIVFYVTYDTSLQATVGRGPIRTSGGVGLDGGLFGSALELGPSASGANLNYEIYDGGDAGDAAVEDSGVPRLLAAREEGSVAFWYRRSATASIQSFVRPYNGASTSGTFPTFGTDNNEIGLFTDLGSTPLLVVSRSALAPFLHDADFDHYAGVWRRANPDAGRTPLLRLAFNGGIGTQVDASVDASGYDAAPDDAGNFSVPWRSQSTSPYAIAAQTMTNLRLGGLSGTTPYGLIDDFAIWERALSFEEIAEIYSSKVPIRQRCALP